MHSYFTRVSYHTILIQTSILFLVSVQTRFLGIQIQRTAARFGPSVPRSLGPHDYRAPTDLKDYQQWVPQQYLVLPKQIETVVVKDLNIDTERF